MATIPRIIVVDSHGGLSDYVRVTMEMMNRRFILLEVPTANVALTEMSNNTVHLIVTLYKTDGTMNGIDFGKRCLHEQASTPVIILAEEDDPSSNELDLEQFTFQYIDYPPGDHFIHAVKIGLDGEDVVKAEQGTAALDLGPIPSLDIDAAHSILSSTVRDLGATGGIISDRSGRIVAEWGATGYIDKAKVATVLGPAFASTIRIAPEVGGYGPQLQHYDGDRYDLYALSVGYHYFMYFIFDGSKRGTFGVVIRYGREGAEKIAELLGEAAWTYKAPDEKPTKAATAVSVSPKTPTPKRTVETPEAPPEPEPDHPVLSEEPILEPVDNLDIDKLFSDDIDDSQLDDIFGDDSMDDVAGLSGNKMSFEEAQNSGLLGD